jgi:hypothetical protein
MSVGAVNTRPPVERDFHPGLESPANRPRPPVLGATKGPLNVVTLDEVLTLRTNGTAPGMGRKQTKLALKKLADLGNHSARDLKSSVFGRGRRVLKQGSIQSFAINGPQTGQPHHLRKIGNRSTLQLR